jgi:hypothetical protein
MNQASNRGQRHGVTRARGQVLKNNNKPLKNGSLIKRPNEEAGISRLFCALDVTR